MKKLFFTLLTLCLCGATYAYDFEVDGIYYNILSTDDGTNQVEVTHNVNGTLTTWPSTYSGTITIPSTVENNDTTYSVVGIGKYAFSHSLDFTDTSSISISIPEGITYIGDYAFCGCLNLNAYGALTIPNSVTSIGDCAFYGCYVFSTLNIGSGLETIGTRAFSWCAFIETITVDPGNTHFVTSDDNRVLFTADKKTLVRFAYSPTYAMLGLEPNEYTIPDGVTTIGSSAFSYCTFMKTFNIPEGVTTIEDEAFSLCAHPQMTSINLPSTLTSIGNGAFMGCEELTEITIPAGVKYIGGDAFYDCAKLQNIILLDNDPSDVKFGATAGSKGVVDIDTGGTLSDKGFDENGNYQWVWGDILEALADYYGNHLTIYVPTGSAAKYLDTEWKNEIEVNDDYWNFNIYKGGINSLSGDRGGTYYATYYTDAVGEFGDDVTPYIVTDVDADGLITEEELTGYIPAGTGVLLKAKPGTLEESIDTYYYHPYGVTEASDGIATTTGNMLYGSLTETTTTVGNGTNDSNYYFYKLTLDSSNTSGSVGFYWGADGGAAFTSEAYKAWLAVPTTYANGLSYYSFKNDEGDTTGISAVESASEKAVKGIYTIQGVRVNNMNQPGLYIVDGKKVLVK